MALGFCPWPVTAAMALNICEVMFWGRAFTARVRSVSTQRWGMGTSEVKVLLVPSLQLPVPDMSSSPARLMLAGVALIEAGVRVLLLLLGVMPVGNGPS